MTSIAGRALRLPSLFRRGAEALRGGVVVQKNLILILTTTPSAEAAATPPKQGGEPFAEQHNTIVKLKPKTFAQLATIFLIAFALKYHYSTASVNDLRWILAPTTFIVETITGRSFTFESHAGYMIDDHTFLIAASCAGVNFLIISFLMLTLGELWRTREIAWRVIPLYAFAAYITTLIANTVRIVIAMWMHDEKFSMRWLDGDELHRIEGIVVYFGFLLLMFFVSDRPVLKDPRRVTLLISIYYAVTLGIPFVRGGYVEPEFWRHAVFVVIIPVIVILPVIAIWRHRSEVKTHSRHGEILSTRLFH